MMTQQKEGDPPTKAAQLATMSFVAPAPATDY